jgi:hypothetical protein
VLTGILDAPLQQRAHQPPAHVVGGEAHFAGGAGADKGYERPGGSSSPETRRNHCLFHLP